MIAKTVENKEDAEEHDQTTTAEASDEEVIPASSSRIRKRKLFPDCVSGNGICF